MRFTLQHRVFAVPLDLTERVLEVASMFGLGADAGREQLVIPRAEVDLPIPGPGVVFITGPSGSGKSTLLRLIAKQCEARGVRVLMMRDDLDHEMDRVHHANGCSASEEGHDGSGGGDGRSKDDGECGDNGDNGDERKGGSGGRGGGGASVGAGDAGVIDRIAPDWPLAEALELLSLTGLGDAFVMLRRPRELSDGQRFRFRLAQMLAAAATTEMTTTKATTATTATTAATTATATKTIVQASNPLPHATAANKICFCKNISQRTAMNGPHSDTWPGADLAPAARDSLDASCETATQTRAIPAGGSTRVQSRQEPVAIFIDEFAATLDRITARTLAANIRRWSDRTGVMFIVATTQDDLVDALQPDVLIHKPLGAAMEVIHARRTSQVDASPAGDETADGFSDASRNESAHEAGHESRKQATREAASAATSDASARIVRSVRVDCADTNAQARAQSPTRASARLSNFPETCSKSRAAKAATGAMAAADSGTSRIAAAASNLRGHMRGEITHRADRTFDDHFRIQPGTIDD